MKDLKKKKKKKDLNPLVPGLLLGLKGLSCRFATLWKTMVKVAQSCPALCNPMNYTVHGILQARKLGWVAFLFSRASSQRRD